MFLSGPLQLSRLFVTIFPSLTKRIVGAFRKIGAVLDNILQCTGRIAETALTPAFRAAGGTSPDGQWHARLTELGRHADHIYSQHAAQSGRATARRRAGGAAPAADAGLVGFDAAECLRLLHQLCDGLARWQQEPVA